MVDDRFDKKADKKCFDDACSDDNQMEWIDMVNQLAVADAGLDEQTFCGHEENEDLLEDRLWQYAQGDMDESMQTAFWEKINDCTFCLARLARMLRSMDVVDQSPVWHLERIRAVVQKAKRARMADRLVSRFKKAVDSISGETAARFERFGEDVKRSFLESFTYPAPRFSAIFGESDFAVTGPYGKVCYPITFEWHPHEEAVEYELRIDELSWVQRTADTKCVLAAGMCELIPGQEYMWELAVYDKEDIVSEESGFFSLASADALKDIQIVETALGRIADDLETRLVFAGLLENQAFYMDAINHYTVAYNEDPLPAVAYRIACCYDQLGLDALRSQWNQKIPVEEPD